LGTPTPDCLLLETYLHDLAAPDGGGVDLLIYQPRFGGATRINRDGGIIAPALGRVIARIVERGAGNTDHARRNRCIGVLFSGENYLRIDVVGRIGGTPRYEGVAGRIRGDGRVPVVRGASPEEEPALGDCVAGSIEAIKLRRGRTIRADGMNLPEIAAILNAGIHESAV